MGDLSPSVLLAVAISQQIVDAILKVGIDVFALQLRQSEGREPTAAEWQAMFDALDERRTVALERMRAIVAAKEQQS